MGQKWKAFRDTKAGRKLRYHVGILAALCLITILFPLADADIAYADTAPDTLRIHSAIVAKNLAEDGDLLILLHYEIGWDNEADYPEEPADQYFLFQILNPIGSVTYAAVQPYPFINGGYGEGVGSFYFTAAETAILGLEWDEQYLLRLTTKIGWINPVEKYDYVVAGTDYCPNDDQETNRLWVKYWILETAQSLETDWDVTAALSTVSIESVLSEGGESYFLRVIPGLRYICPDLFTLTVICPEPPAESGTPELAETLKERGEYEGTIVESALDTLGSLASGNEQLALNICAIALILGLMGLSYWKLQTARPGMLLGLYTLPIGAELRFTELAVVGAIALLYTLFVGKILFYDKG